MAPQPEQKYIQEIGAEMIGNQLIIRMEKDKRKKNKKQDQWNPPCDCDMVEIRRPSKNEGPKIVNGGAGNQIVFQVSSKTHVTGKDNTNFKPQTITYQINEAEKVGQCRKIMICPTLQDSGFQEVSSNHISEGDQNIFLLRVQKKGEQKNRNVELELWTPKPPTLSKTTPSSLQPPPVQITQSEESQKTQDLKEGLSNTNKKKKSKKKK